MTRTIRPEALPAAIFAGVAVAALVLTIARPRRRVGARLDDYTLVARSKLGTAPGAAALARQPPPLAGALARVLGPMVDAAARRVAAIARAHDDATLEAQLRHAGVRDLTPARYRKQQFLLGAAGTVGGLVLGAALGAASGRSAAPLAVVFATAGFVLGSVWKTAELARRIRERQAVMRAELFVLCQVLAIYARATPNLLQICQLVVRRSSGEVAGEMAEILRSVESGTAPERAFAEAARTSCEPAAGRLYRAMATAVESGGDIADALLAQSADLRDAQREDLRRRATTQRAKMLVPLVFVLAPIMLLFVAAPFPRMVLRL